MTALALALELLVLGLHVLIPWRLAGRARVSAAAPAPADAAAHFREKPDPRHLWALLATPLLFAAAIAGALTLQARLDSALAWSLTWPPTSTPALALLFASATVALADLVLFAGWRRLEPIGWRLVAVLGAALLLAASVAGELLRTGRTPLTSLAGLGIAILCRVLLALAAGEVAAGPLRGFATAAGAALPLTLLGLGAPARAGLGADLATLGAASLLLLAARFLPPSLRRPAAVAGVVLAVLFLDRTGVLSASYEPASSVPDLFLPEP